MVTDYDAVIGDLKRTFDSMFAVIKRLEAELEARGLLIERLQSENDALAKANRSMELKILSLEEKLKTES